MIFFTLSHPILVSDTDDWLYINRTRVAWPTLEEWNPVRIFPEIFMPIIAY